MPQTFAWTLAAACLALVAIAAAHYYSVYRSERIGQETAERVNLELVRQAVVVDVATVVTDLFVLARHVEQMALPRAGQALPDLERVFVIFAEQKRLSDQIRFIDPGGRETLRVNLENGRASSVSAGALQDKSQRYYVAAARGLAPGDMYVSPLDLNIERGEIELPLKPVMRFATAVFDDQGGRAGMVVLNYLGQWLLDRVEEAAGTGAARLHLIDPDGYWLKSLNPEDARGFMPGSDRRFERLYPGEWQLIAA